MKNSDKNKIIYIERPKPQNSCLSIYLPPEPVSYGFDRVAKILSKITISVYF